MTLLSKVVTGKIRKPILGIVYGPSGVGKTTLAGDAPSPIFIGAEDGTFNMDVARFPSPKNFTEVVQMVTELTNLDHQHKTLVIDSLDWLERLLHKDICAKRQVEHIEEIAYGKGYLEAMTPWRQLTEALTTLRDKKGMNIILIAHAHIKSMHDPKENKAYDRYNLKLNEKASALFREYVDFILFATYEVFVKTENGKNLAFSTGARVAYTEWRAAHEGKNRFGLPYQIPLSFEALSEAITAGTPEKPEVLKRQITALAEALTDPATKVKVFESIKGTEDPGKLAKILNRVEALSSTQAVA